MFLSVVFLFAVLAARVLLWLFLCRGKDLCRQPFGIPVEHARDENAVTMEFLGHVSVIRCRRWSLPVSFTFSHLRFLPAKLTVSSSDEASSLQAVIPSLVTEAI